MWRGLGLDVVEVGLGDPLPTDAHLYYLGGGQDRDQIAVAEDLAGSKGRMLRDLVGDGACLLAVCGGYQLAGHGYTGVDGTRMHGVGILDADTVAGGPPRLIGDVVIEARIGDETHTVVGFENHAGRTRLGPGSRPLGTVISGHGNNGTDGSEGAVTDRAIGTYLHGPLLPKNPWLADRLIAWALEYATGTAPQLAPIDDHLEEAAHAAAIARARRPNR
jgi:CobQ-like glutamine amidotransferase family enzyme